MKRRSFLTASAAALAGASVLPTFATGKPGKSANGRLNVAFIKEPVRKGWEAGEDLWK